MNTPTDAIAVVGGGWAGCAAAVALADAGHRVELFEAAAHLGGRARRVERHGLALDNGQHLMLGAYRATRALLDRLHATPPVALRPLAMAPFAHDQPNALAMTAWRLPAPFNLLMGVLCARGLTLAERVATLRWFARLKAARYQCPRAQTVAALTASLPPAVAERLWHPLCLAALNTPAARASAQVFANVLRAAFGEGAHGSDLLTPHTDLGALVPDATKAWLESRGHRVHLQSTATVVDVDSGAIRLDTQHAQHAFRGAVIAVAPHQLARTMSPALVAREQSMRDAADLAEALEWEPITTAYLGYRQAIEMPDAMIRLDDAPGQWLFARPDIVRSARSDAPSLAFVVAVVLSAHGAHDALPHDTLAAAVDQQLRDRRADWPALAWSQVIEEKRATYACTPTSARPLAGLLVAGLALAGDYTDHEFPATLEAAVRSGNRAAAAFGARPAR